MTVEQVVQAVKWVGWWMYNASLGEFADVMMEHGIDSRAVIEGQWDAMLENPMKWFFNLEPGLQERIARAALDCYQDHGAEGRQ